MRTESDSLRKSSFNMTAADVSGHAFATGEGRRSEVSVDALVMSPGESKPTLQTPYLSRTKVRGSSFTHVVEAQVAVGKNKATSANKATPASDNWKGRVQREVLVERGARFRCAIRCLHRKGAPDGKPTPSAESWQSRSALATLHQRQPCRLFPRQANQRRPRETDRGDGARPRVRRDGEALGVPTEIIRPGKTWERNQPNRA